MPSNMDRVREIAGCEPGEPLPSFAWPGGYPLYYLTEDGGTLCPDCANGKNGSECQNPECQDDPQWALVGCDVLWEGHPVHCEHCHTEIESAYGVADDESEDVADDGDEPHGPQEGDITTEDHCRWYCEGKLILHLAPETDHARALREWMDCEGYFPDVWFISDHGNAHRISLEG